MSLARQPVQFDFIRGMLVDAANAVSSFRYVPQSEDRPLDIVENMTVSYTHLRAHET